MEAYLKACIRETNEERLDVFFLTRSLFYTHDDAILMSWLEQFKLALAEEASGQARPSKMSEPQRLEGFAQHWLEHSKNRLSPPLMLSDEFDFDAFLSAADAVSHKAVSNFRVMQSRFSRAREPRLRSAQVKMPKKLSPWRKLPLEGVAQELTLRHAMLILELDARRALSDQTLVDAFNLDSLWVATEILLCSDSERSGVVAQFVRLGTRLAEMNNFSGAVALTLGLSHAAVRRLRSVHERLSAKVQDQLRSLEELASPAGNYRVLRSRVAAVGPEGGAIPYAGLWMRDLAITRETHPLTVGTGGKEAVNLELLQRVAGTMSEIRIVQKSCTRYSFAMPAVGVERRVLANDDLLMAISVTVQGLPEGLQEEIGDISLGPGGAQFSQQLLNPRGHEGQSRWLRSELERNPATTSPSSSPQMGGIFPPLLDSLKIPAEDSSATSGDVSESGGEEGLLALTSALANPAETARQLSVSAFMHEAFDDGRSRWASALMDLVLRSPGSSVACVRAAMEDAFGLEERLMGTLSYPPQASHVREHETMLELCRALEAHTDPEKFTRLTALAAAHLQKADLSLGLALQDETPPLFRALASLHFGVPMGAVALWPSLCAVLGDCSLSEAAETLGAAWVAREDAGRPWRALGSSPLEALARAPALREAAMGGAQVVAVETDPEDSSLAMIVLAVPGGGEAAAHFVCGWARALARRAFRVYKAHAAVLTDQEAAPLKRRLEKDEKVKRKVRAKEARLVAVRLPQRSVPSSEVPAALESASLRCSAAGLLSLPETTLLREMHPFFFACQVDDRVSVLGPAVQRLLPQSKAGDRLGDRVFVEAPWEARGPLSTRAIRKANVAAARLRLQSPFAAEPVMLHGQFIISREGDAREKHIFFFGAPVGNLGLLHATGLTLGDLGLQDGAAAAAFVSRTLRAPGELVLATTPERIPEPPPDAAAGIRAAHSRDAGASRRGSSSSVSVPLSELPRSGDQAASPGPSRRAFGDHAPALLDAVIRLLHVDAAQGYAVCSALADLTDSPRALRALHVTLRALDLEGGYMATRGAGVAADVMATCGWHWALPALRGEVTIAEIAGSTAEALGKEKGGHPAAMPSETRRVWKLLSEVVSGASIREALDAVLEERIRPRPAAFMLPLVREEVGAVPGKWIGDWGVISESLVKEAGGESKGLGGAGDDGWALQAVASLLARNVRNLIHLDAVHQYVILGVTRGY